MKTFLKTLYILMLVLISNTIVYLIASFIELSLTSYIDGLLDLNKSSYRWCFLMMNVIFTIASWRIVEDNI